MKTLFAFLTVGLLAFAASATAQVPQFVTYQIRVTPEPLEGTPVKIGIYQDSHGIREEWEDTLAYHSVGGVCSFNIGKMRSLPAVLTVPSYVGVQFAGQTICTPLTELASAPYALYSGWADTAGVARDAVRATWADHAPPPRIVSDDSTWHFTTDSLGVIHFRH